ncbi:MAG: outer membrane beta-barrel protein, partial [Hyphomicrobiaceae bacterium]
MAPIRRASADAASDGATDPDEQRFATTIEPEAAPEPTLPEDGVLRQSEPPLVLDGDVTVDQRPDEERQAFIPAEPPTGYDPNPFSIEVEPSQDRRPAQFTQLDPYAPTGLRLGSFLLFPEAEIDAAAVDNVLRSTSDRQGDVALECRPAARRGSGWGVRGVVVGAGGGA